MSFYGTALETINTNYSTTPGANSSKEGDDKLLTQLTHSERETLTLQTQGKVADLTDKLVKLMSHPNQSSMGVPNTMTLQSKSFQIKIEKVNLTQISSAPKEEFTSDRSDIDEKSSKDELLVSEGGTELPTKARAKIEVPSEVFTILTEKLRQTPNA